MSNGTRLASFAVAAILPWSASAANGDVAEGKKVAVTWCSACHAVGAQNSGTDAAPSFLRLAQERSAHQLRAFLANPHGRMPNIQLSRQQVEDVTRFIQSRRREQ